MQNENRNAAIEQLLRSGFTCLNDGRFDEALYWFERARGLAPELPPVLEGAGHALMALGRPTEALTLFQKLQSVAPQASVGFHGAAEAFKQLGRLKEARRAAERAVALAPEVAGHHYLLAQFDTFVENDPRLADMEKLARRAGTLPERDRCELHFALGKAYDDLGRHADAFAHWSEGNALKRRSLAYDEPAFLGILRDLAAAFTPAAMEPRLDAGDPSELPIFVVGMPRSGTSLIEQIIASHPQAFGAGETMYLHHLLGQGLLGQDFPSGMDTLPAEAFRRYGSFYATRLGAHAPGAARIVDKLPANFMLVGLIKIALPRARIIHVRRDAMDTCFSCFVNLFAQNIDYSYDLGELGRYCSAYRDLMAHWRAVLPDGAMLEVDYEEIVADFEAQARRIIAYCGLAWDERCLSFHKTDRVVHTMSAAQVREPIYRKAVGRAAPYAPWLTALKQALGAEA